MNDKIVKTLSKCIAEIAGHFALRVPGAIEMIAIDCHPWDAILTLSFLTHAESIQDPLLADAAEMAAWKYFRFGAEEPEWRPALELAKEMKRAYASTEDRLPIADAHLRLCAEAFSIDPAKRQILHLNRTPTFRVSVAHPDTGREYGLPPKIWST